MSLDALPAGLPPGRLVTPDPRFSPQWSGGPDCWASQEPIPDAPQQWARRAGGRAGCRSHRWPRRRTLSWVPPSRSTFGRTPPETT
jgi:hypothetical protein